METQNPPNHSSFPRLPKSEVSQILTHPEHILGNLKLIKQKADSGQPFFINQTAAAVGIFFGILLVVQAFTFFLHKTEAFQFANKSSAVITDSRVKIDNINNSLELLYNARSGAKTEEDVTVSKNTVLGASTSINSDGTMSAAALVAEKLKDVVDKTSQVKAFSVPAGDPTAAVRKHRELARDIATRVAAAKEDLATISNLNNQDQPGTSENLKNKLDNLESKIKSYIDQAQKTSDYYIDISQASLDLYTIGLTTSTVKDIDSDISKITLLKSKFATYKNLPEEMTPYNTDVVDTFELLTRYFGNLKVILTGATVDLPKEYANFALQLHSLSSRSSVDEISFWQNNKNLSNYQDLSKEHTETITLAGQVKKTNNFFLLETLGVK